MNTPNTAMTTALSHTATVNTARLSRRETRQRLASFGLAAVMTLSILGSINLLASEPAADSLLAQHSTLLAQASAGAPARAPQV